jgi:cytochrome c5
MTATITRPSLDVSLLFVAMALSLGFANALAAEGKAIYDKACVVCHAAGVAGAPKFGDKAAWKDRIAKGKETLYSHSIKGFNAMPPKGGNVSLSDAEVKAAVDYMLSQAQ